MTCSGSVGLIIRCNITPRHSSKVSSEDKLLSFWCRGGVPRVPRAVATPLNIRCSNIASATVCNFVSKWRSVFRMQMSFAVQRTCQPLKPYRRMTSSRWRAVLRTAATGRQSWDGSTQSQLYWWHRHFHSHDGYFKADDYSICWLAWLSDRLCYLL